MRGTKRTWVLAAAVGAAALLVLFAASASFLTRVLSNNVTERITVLPEVSLAPAEPLPTSIPEAITYEAPAKPLNILFLGSDTREGQGPGFGNLSGFNGDTTMLMHVSADRKNASILSIPRDLWLEIPTCKAADGTTYQASEGKFNSALPRGGPDCVIKTVTKLTGVPIHHVAVIDFTGFSDMVDAVGGIKICLNEPVQDQWADADLPAGEQIINGKEALALARARKTLSDGSDIARIDRQQALLLTLYRQVSEKGLLADPTGLYDLAKVAAENLATDPELASAPALVGLAKDLRSISPDDIKFLTVPWNDRGDGENVVVDWEKATPIFTALANDTPLPSREKQDKSSNSGNASNSNAVCKDPLW